MKGTSRRVRDRIVNSAAGLSSSTVTNESVVTITNRIERNEALVRKVDR